MVLAPVLFFTAFIVSNDASKSPRGVIVTRERIVVIPLPVLSRVLFLEFCSTISAHLIVFLISQVQEGKDGRSDTLLVSQFGLTRGGAVSRLDLDPPPRLPRLFGAEGVAGAGAGAGGLFVGRTQPRLTGTWTSPLVWPNEVNEVCPGCDFACVHLAALWLCRKFCRHGCTLPSELLLCFFACSG